MTVYLMQHGKPLSKADDPERPLSPEGINDVGNLAEFLHRLGINVQDVYHSGKKRARETAEIMASRLTSGTEPIEKNGLSPMDDVGDMADHINNREGDLLITGHLPHLSKLTSLLVTGSVTIPIVSFQQGGVVCLERSEDDGWTVAWMLVPEILT